MPPIRQLDEAFLSSLLEGDDNTILNTKVESESLTSVLKKLNSTSDALQQDLFQQVHTNFHDFSSWYNTSQALHSKVLSLVQQSTITQDQVSHTQEHVNNTLEKYRAALSDTQKSRRKIDTLEHLEQVLEITEAIDTELQQYDYLNAVKHITQLNTILTQWKEGDTRITSMLNDRVQQLRQSLVLGLQDGIHTAIKYNSGSIRILQTYHPANDVNVSIRNVFQSLLQLGLLPEELMIVQRSIIKNIMYPYFEHANCTIQIDQVQVPSEGEGGVLQVIGNTSQDEDMERDEKSASHVDPIQMLQQIETILGYFYTYIFNDSAVQEDKEMKLLFGNLLMPDLIQLMIDKSIAPAVPSSKYNLADFDHVTQAVTQFENHCRDKYGFQVEEAGITPLGSYVKNIDKHYAKKRRNRILQEGRKVMVRRLYDTDMVQVKESDDHTYQYQITQTPQILSMLVSDTIAEASELLGSHPISASTLIDGVQDLLDMYRAIMPSYHRTQYLSTAANSLVFRNDCFWLANQITTSVTSKTDTTGFTDLKKGLQEASARLRELGKAWHELAMMQRVRMIQTVLDHLDGFSGMAENAKFQQDCDRAISQVIQLVNSFAAETRPVIDETLFLDIMGRIVDNILSRLISDIEELVDIGAEESHVIARTLNSLAQLVNAFDLPGKDATESFVDDLVPNWQKFWLVKDILEMNMRDIMNAYRRGDLHMFEKSELVGLLCALFADTELRESNIQEIKTGRSSQQHTETARSSTPTQTIMSPQPTIAHLQSRSPDTPSSHHLEYTPDDDMEVEESGWGDDDDDLFANEPLAQEQEEKRIVTPSLDYEMDLDEDAAVGGWGDADEDIFDIPEATAKEAVPPPTTTTTATTPAATTTTTAAPITSPTSTIPPATTTAVPATGASSTEKEKVDSTKSSTKSALTAPELNIEELEDEDGSGWGWDDGDDDLFNQ